MILIDGGVAVVADRGVVPLEADDVDVPEVVVSADDDAPLTGVVALVVVGITDFVTVTVAVVACVVVTVAGLALVPLPHPAKSPTAAIAAMTMMAVFISCSLSLW